jgi:hypothetical protein
MSLVAPYDRPFLALSFLTGHIFFSMLCITSSINVEKAVHFIHLCFGTSGDNMVDWIDTKLLPHPTHENVDKNKTPTKIQIHILNKEK